MRGTPEQRFWAKVQKTDECWIWTAASVRTDHHRLVSNKQNGENRVEVPGATPRGVAWRPDKNAFRARVMHNYKEHFAGYHATEEEAAEAARLKRLELFTHNDLDRKSA